LQTNCSWDSLVSHWTLITLNALRTRRSITRHVYSYSSYNRNG
jgi:hypothetical protein